MPQPAPAPRQRSRKAVWITAVVLAACTAALDVVIHDTSTSLVAILFAAMVMGYLAPQRAWRWGLLIGLSLPLSHLAARRGGELAGVMAFVPSFVGAYLGMFLDKMVRELRGR